MLVREGVINWLVRELIDMQPARHSELVQELRSEAGALESIIGES